MSRTKYFLFGFIVGLLTAAAGLFVFYAVFKKPVYMYSSSPGFLTSRSEEQRKEFDGNKPHCVGVSIPVENYPNRNIDSEGKSICVGFLVPLVKTEEMDQPILQPFN